MKRRVFLALPLCVLAALPLAAHAGNADRPQPVESIWIEAEQLHGIRGTCWPMGKPEMRKTAGHWGISGPGWAAEWNQGGESGFLSIACGADDAKAEASIDLEIPAAGTYRLWVRYRDVREASNRFQVEIKQPGAAMPWLATYGQHPLFDEDNVMKLYWGAAFGWESHEATLTKGNAQLTLRSAFKEPDCRQIDCMVLTTDSVYRPWIKERPTNYAWQVLQDDRNKAAPLAQPLARTKAPPAAHAAWKLRTFNDRGFLFLWNVNQFDWLSDNPKRILFPYSLSLQPQDQDVREEFQKTFAGRSEVPVFSDPRIVPVFHGAGPLILDAAQGKEHGDHVTPGFVRWLDKHPQRAWATMMNYAADTPMSREAYEQFLKYRDRYIGSIAGENLGYFEPYVDSAAKQKAFSSAHTRRELAEALGRVYMQANRAKWRKVYGRDVDAPYREVIPVVGTAYYPLCFHWGARTVGCELTSVTGCMQSMNLAMLRGAARQTGGMVLTYRSGNFGDSSAGFNYGNYATVKQLLDNYYSPYSGAGMTWWKLDGWYQYMAGSAMFYEEGGHDTYWKPGGLTAAGIKEVQLSPRGKLTDRFLRLTAEQPDRGTPYTPVAILMDYAHGVSPSPYVPALFDAQDSPQWAYSAPGNIDHVRNALDTLWLAYFPIGPRSQEPLTAMTESFVPGVFGDIFDVVFADPKIESWHTLDSYAVTIVAGDIELTEAEGRRLNQYVTGGGTLLVAAGQLKGPGAAVLDLPASGPQRETFGYRWGSAATVSPSQHYRYQPLALGKSLATTADGQTICTSIDRGKGRLVYLSIPYALGIDKQVTPLAARLFVSLTSGLMPIEVEGDVEWLVNRTKDGWLVTLINSAGDLKPQQGIFPTDFRQNRRITIHAKVPISRAADRLLASERLTVKNNQVSTLVPAGGICIVELK